MSTVSTASRSSSRTSRPSSRGSMPSTTGRPTACTTVRAARGWPSPDRAWCGSPGGPTLRPCGSMRCWTSLCWAATSRPCSSTRAARRGSPRPTANLTGWRRTTAGVSAPCANFRPRRSTLRPIRRGSTAPRRGEWSGRTSGAARQSGWLAAATCSRPSPPIPSAAKSTSGRVRASSTAWRAAAWHPWPRGGPNHAASAV